MKPKKLKVTKRKGKKPMQKKEAKEDKGPVIYNFEIQKNADDGIIEYKDLCSVCGFGMKRPMNGLEGALVSHQCSHKICLKCLQKNLEKQFSENASQFKCQFCSFQFSNQDINQIHPKLFDKISEKLTLEAIKDLTECEFCGSLYEIIQQPLPADKILSDVEKSAYINCITCGECHVSTCKKCHAVPYHYGETCEEHDWYVNGYVCRICGCAANPANAQNKKTALLTCDNPECKNISSQMCKTILSCGHACVGCGCGNSVTSKHPLCPICTVGQSLCQHCKKPLWGSPCLLLKCGHTIHHRCALEIIKRPRTGPVLSLPLCPAPGCGFFVSHQLLSTAAPDDFREWSVIEREVNRIAAERVAAEGIKFHPEVASRLMPFSWAEDLAPLNWAKKRLRFMRCKKHGPGLVLYTAGRLEDPEPDAASMCPLCPGFRFPVCSRCGPEAMAYKCARCCSVGVRLITQQNGRPAGWECEICHDMPRSIVPVASSGCKGNCRFSPHPAQTTNFYGICTRCNALCTKSIMFLAERM